MSVNYDKARGFGNKLAEKTANDERKKNEKYYDEDTTDEERQEDVEAADEIEEGIKLVSELFIDIAESLHKIAQGDKLGRGRRMS